jgi:hypothetical protein
MDDFLARMVRERASHACEYCGMPQEFYPTVPFPIDQPDVIRVRRSLIEEGLFPP